MCELLGISSAREVRANDLLARFFEHSDANPHGWGLAYWNRGDAVRLVKEPVKASESRIIPALLSEDISCRGLIAHIRRATIGHMDLENTHPFVKKDHLGRTCVMVHNGTIFESSELKGYEQVQAGTTDSERILLYILDRLGTLEDTDGRIRIMDSIVKELSANNKLNLMFFDGEYLYIHKNEARTLFRYEDDGYTVFATKPLNGGLWKETPLNRLQVYRDGVKVYEGTAHDHTYVENEEHMRMLYLNYSSL